MASRQLKSMDCALAFVDHIKADLAAPGVQPERLAATLIGSALQGA